MATCFVIQPFDGGKYDKRYDDVFAPAIKAADLEPYRVDQDPKVEVPIEAIEQGISAATVCLADITTDNPNVWYELGYAFASGKPVVMVCSDERTGKRYPFDIQHRTIISYVSESTQDFQKLQHQITTRIKALADRGQAIREIAESEQIANVEGLSQAELLVLASIAGLQTEPDGSVSVYLAQKDVVRAGFTPVGFSLGLHRLRKKELVVVFDSEDERDGGVYRAVRVTEQGWDWIERHEDKFILRRPSLPPDEEVPF